MRAKGKRVSARNGERGREERKERNNLREQYDGQGMRERCVDFVGKRAGERVRACVMGEGKVPGIFVHWARN
jgi:hypothetical protein